MRVQLGLGLSLLLVTLLRSAWSLVGPVMPDIPTAWLTTSTLTGLALLGTSFISAYSLISFQGLYSHELKKQWSHGYYLALTTGTFVLIAEALLVSGPIPIDIAPPWLISGLLPLAALAYTRTEFGKAKLRESRRERRSTKYVRRYIARTADGDDEYDDLHVNIQGMIRLKSFIPNYSRAWQRKALKAMGLKVPKRKTPTDK